MMEVESEGEGEFRKRIRDFFPEYYKSKENHKLIPSETLEKWFEDAKKAAPLPFGEWIKKQPEVTSQNIVNIDLAEMHRKYEIEWLQWFVEWFGDLEK